MERYRELWSKLTGLIADLTLAEISGDSEESKDIRNEINVVKTEIEIAYAELTDKERKELIKGNPNKNIGK